MFQDLSGQEIFLRFFLFIGVWAPDPQNAPKSRAEHLKNGRFRPKNVIFLLWRQRVQKNSRFQGFTRLIESLRIFLVIGALASNDRKVSVRSFRSFQKCPSREKRPISPQSQQAQKNCRSRTLVRLSWPLRSLLVMGASASNDRKVSVRSLRKTSGLCG